MNTSKMISAAFLISGLFLSSNTAAQAIIDGADNRRQTQEVEVDGDGAAVLPRSLDFEISGHSFRISGGQPGAMCGFLFGFERTSMELPSGHMLYVQPLLVFGVGHFDADGAYEVTVGYDAKMLRSAVYHFQAIAIEVAKDGFEQLKTSQLVSLDFTGLPPEGEMIRGGDDREDGAEREKKADPDVDEDSVRDRGAEGDRDSRQSDDG